RPRRRSTRARPRRWSSVGPSSAVESAGGPGPDRSRSRGVGRAVRPAPRLVSLVLLQLRFRGAGPRPGGGQFGADEDAAALLAAQDLVDGGGADGGHVRRGLLDAAGAAAAPDQFGGGDRLAGVDALVELDERVGDRDGQGGAVRLRLGRLGFDRAERPRPGALGGVHGALRLGGLLAGGREFGFEGFAALHEL